MNKYIKQFNTLSLRERRIATISGLVILSFFPLLFTNQFDIKLTIINTFFQFTASWILSYVFTQFYNKYYNSSSFTWWIRFYVFMILGTILWGVLLRVETGGV